MRTEGRIRAGDPDTVELRLPPHPENLALARLALTGVAGVAGLSEPTLADLKLAVTEACTNAILHGSSRDSTGGLVVRYRLGTGRLEVEVEDEGAGFDPDDPGARESAAEGQGMGLLIIRSTTDEVKIESDSTGSRISFTKLLSV
ncbi:MAG TPA: ATP-binding protein [Gaiellaceae bacterium]|jgi:serine/threonine-protein kinase RsbW|nr:ATP-binding protein [Gaiellaceae bacterium]